MAGFLLAVGCAAVFVVWREWERRQQGVSWFANFDLDATPFLLFLLLLPICWFVRSPDWPHAAARLALAWFGPQTKPGEQIPHGGRWRGLVLAGFVGLLSLAASLHVAYRSIPVGRSSVAFGDLPPAYHDEYSYRMQSEIFLAGRWSFASHPRKPELFDQMHVVNQGRYSSRYFPATAAWMTPFVGLGRPHWGHWVAGMLAAMFVFAAGRELGGNGVGLIAGGLTAVAPGMAVFSNLLLAHHPALIGLTLFLWMFLRLLRTGALWCALLAGVGLSFAMLARPMTAFGFGLPFGAVFIGWIWRHGFGAGEQREPRLRRAGGLLAAMGLPILMGFAVLAWQNQAVTGDWSQTPYEQFNDVYTPRHVFGFNNGERAEQRVAAGEARSNDVFLAYDKWAANLTARRAVENVGKRIPASAQWTLGIVPLGIAVIVFLIAPHQDERRWWLIAAGLGCLHVVHVPYWYAGILDWHYVFETGPLLLLLFARASQLLWGWWRAADRGWLPVWWAGLAGVALGTAYFPLEPFWSTPRVDAEVAKLAYSKKVYREFRYRLEREIPSGKALVLVEPSKEIHFEFVVNPPDLENQDVLIGRLRPGHSIDAIAAAFPDRAVFVWRSPPRGEIEQVAAPR